MNRQPFPCLGDVGQMLPDGVRFSPGTSPRDWADEILQEIRAIYSRDTLDDGRVAILELNDVSWFPRTFGHHTDPEVIIEEMEEAGYVLERDHGFIDRQSFLIFGRGASE